MNITLGFIGYGNMGRAVAQGLLGTGLLVPSRLLVHDPAATPPAGAHVAGSAEEVLREADVILLAVKPQVFAEAGAAWAELAAGLSGKIVISVMAGIRTDRLRAAFPGFTVIRVMPNLGLSVGQGATAIAMDGVPADSLDLAEVIFRSSGTIVRVTEDRMDAVTAVSGSGPMYLFEFVGAMTEAGVKAGLARETAYALAVQTTKGSLKLLETSTDTPEAWTKRVCSPGGTTLAALGVLQREGFHGILERAVAAAKKRSEELSA
ncbi:MAG TPA: pyrroline-5-carboxylate reductase [Fibrobacteria bacterium]|jgi:pyrroline-5-carboxylate reductase|nr:pyrroline-5-carboxylate reductase [Fibrobacteria bacterium]